MNEKTVTWYYGWWNNNLEVISNLEGFVRHLLLPCSIILDRETDNITLAVLEQPESFNRQVYLRDHFEVGKTYFLGEILGDHRPFDEVKEWVQDEKLYNLETQSFVTLEDLQTWQEVWCLEDEGKCIMYKIDKVVEVVLTSDDEPRVFKDPDQECYYTWTAYREDGDEVIRVSDAEAIELIQLDPKEALEQLAIRYQLALDYDKYSYWEDQPFFRTSTGKRIWAVTRLSRQEAPSFRCGEECRDLLF